MNVVDVLAKDVPSRGMWECVYPPPPPSTFLKFAAILTKCVRKISILNFSLNVEYFIIKKRNTEFCQYPVPQKSNIYWQ